MSFASPSLLLLLVAVPLVAIAYAMLERARQARAHLWSRPEMLSNLVRDPLRRWRFVPTLSFMIGLSFLIVGVARPERVRPISEVGAPTVVLTFDLSSSMGARDVEPSRLAVARSIARAFLRELPTSDRVAIVVFGNTPTETVPPTLDRGEVISNFPRSVRSRSGTAIGDAVNEAVAVAAGEVGAAQNGDLYHPGAVLLFSDGGQNAGGVTPREAAISALEDYVPVDAVAIGTTKGTVTQTTRVAGYPTPVVIPVPLDSATLSTLSQQTEGQFFEARAVERSASALSGVYRGLRPYVLPGHAVDDLSALSAALSLVFIAGAVALSGFLFGRIA